MTFDPYEGCDPDECPVCHNMRYWYACHRCAGDGLVEYMDSPDLWFEDTPSLVNHLCVCPDCEGKGGEWFCPTCEKQTGKEAEDENSRH